MDRIAPVPPSWRCPLCHFFAARALKGVLRHIGAVHAHEANFQVICGVQGCPRSYSNYHSYKKHMYQKHREVLEVVNGSSAQGGEGESTENGGLGGWTLNGENVWKRACSHSYAFMPCWWHGSLSSPFTAHAHSPHDIQSLMHVLIAAATVAVSTLKYKEALRAELPDIAEESEVTRYCILPFYTYT